MGLEYCLDAHDDLDINTLYEHCKIKNGSDTWEIKNLVEHLLLSMTAVIVNRRWIKRL